jgi:peptidoglycan/LPS O-acetylase OafA/YrhL
MEGIMEQKISQRRYDLDWLRVVAILAIFIFHNGRFFDTGGWHVKNPVTYPGMDYLTGFLGSWIMPIIFIISGASLFFGLGKGGFGRFLKDKVLRLLVPLAVGAFTHVSLQVYLERQTQGGFSGSYFQFLPHYFEGLYAFGGNFAWMGLHLWYLEILFLFSLIFYPLLRWLKNGSGQRLLNGLGSLLAKPGAVALLAVPGTLLYATLDPRGFEGMRDFGGWPLLVYVFYFLAGFQIIAHAGLQDSIKRQRWFTLAAAAVTSVATIALNITAGEAPYGSLNYTLTEASYSLMSWSILLAFLGFAFQHLNLRSPFLQYANEAVLPFYIMHQTVILGLGYFVVQTDLPAWLKYGITSVCSLIVILGLYELLVRRWNVLRVLFGMKPQVRPAVERARTVVGSKAV